MVAAHAEELSLRAEEHGHQLEALQSNADELECKLNTERIQAKVSITVFIFWRSLV